MSKYKILATIYVEGKDIKTEERALDELSNMKEIYDEAVEENNISIIVKFINEEVI